MTELAHYEPNTTGSVAIITGGQMDDFVNFAKTLAMSNLLPDALRGKAADVFMALMEGLDLGLRPMQALNLIDVIKGKPALKAEGKRALLQRDGHGFRIVEWSDEKCVVEGCRKGETEWHQASFTKEQAKKAGLTGDNWSKYPADMLLARATSRLCKAYFADVTNGLATSEEVIDETPRPSLGQVAAERETPAVLVQPPDEQAAAVRDLAAEFGQPEPEADVVANAEVVVEDPPADFDPETGELIPRGALK